MDNIRFFLLLNLIFFQARQFLSCHVFRLFPHPFSIIPFKRQMMRVFKWPNPKLTKTSEEFLLLTPVAFASGQKY